MAAQIKLTTTGTQTPVVFTDLGKRQFTHPTTNYDLLTEFKSTEIYYSTDIQSAITSGYITLVDESGNSITTLQNQIYPYSKTQTDALLALRALLISSATNGHIVTTNGSGQPLDSGKLFNDSGTSVSDIWSASQVGTAINTAISGLSGWMKYKGVIDCSGNPNYPASTQGDVWIASVAGKIGGASGIAVEIGDMILCQTTNAGGTQAAVGANFDIIQTNITGAMTTTDTSSTLNAIVREAGTSGQTAKTSLATVSDTGVINIPSGATYNINGSPLAQANIVGLTTASTVTFTGLNLSGLTASQTVETDASKNLITVAKATAYNQAFEATLANIASDTVTGSVGTLSTIARADHSHPTIAIQDALWTPFAARNSANTTNTYLWSDDLPTNTTPFVADFNCTLIGISAATSANATWTAEVHQNGSLLTGATLTLTGVSKAQRSDLSINITAGDSISLYCNGSSIPKPKITAIFKRR